MSGHGTPAPAPHGAGAAAKGKPLGLIGALLLVLLLVFVANKFTGKKGGDTAAEEKTAVHHSTVGEGEKIPVEFGQEYSEIVHLPRSATQRIFFSFERATQPYCVINSAGTEACTNRATKDVADDMPGTLANHELRFKSNNGNPGHLEIRIERVRE